MQPAACKLLRVSLLEVWHRFADETTIHGLKFVMDKRGNVFSRITWMLLTLGGFVASNLLVETFWLRYKSNPTRLSVESSHVPLNQLILPALTFCQISRVDLMSATYLIDRLVLPTNVTRDDAFKLLGHSAGFIDNMAFDANDLRLADELLATNNISVLDMAQYFQQPCEQMLVKCRWQSKMLPCAKLLEPAMSYHGGCCSFRMFRFAKYSQLESGLSLALAPSTSYQAYSSTYSEGVKLLIHESRIYPSDLSVEKMISHRSETIVRISSTLTICSKSVRLLDMEDRDCLFQPERRLEFFGPYKENNCDVLCRMKKIISYCDCLPYYFHHVAPDVETCNFTQIQCLVGNYYQIHKFNKWSIDPFYENLNRTHMVVHIIFGKQVFRQMRRDLLTNILTLAAGLGGIYSLFIGMSVITFFEVVYFATIRLHATYMRRKNDSVETMRIYQQQSQLIVRELRVFGAQLSID